MLESYKTYRALLSVAEPGPLGIRSIYQRIYICNTPHKNIGKLDLFQYICTVCSNQFTCQNKR